MTEWRETCPDLPAAFAVPKGYSVDFTGVWVERKGKEDAEPTRVPVTSGPVVPVGVLVDPDGAQLVELAFWDGVRWVRRSVPRGVVNSGRRLIAALGDVGFPATEGDARGVERWLARCEAENRRRIRRRQLARWLGWQPDGSFVFGHDRPRSVEPTWPEQASALAAHHARGSLEGWQAVVSRLKPYPAAVAALAPAFAAPLLDVLGLDSFTVDISGRSTRGKTTAAKVALSAWADPSERGDAMASWRTTLLAVEKRLNLVRGLPVVLDETRVVKSPELVDQVLYQVPKNHGQARGGGWPSLLPWHTIVISTGEQSALSFTTHQGAGARVLTLTAPPFPAGGTSAEDAVAIGKGITEEYGTAGPAFATRLRQELERDGGREEIRRRHAELTERHQGKTDLSARRAPLLASLVLAGELAHAWGVVPLEPLGAEDWDRLFTSTEFTDDRPGMALDLVREFVAANRTAIYRGPDWHGTPPPSGWIGRLVKRDDKLTVALLPQRLREALQRGGYELAAVLPGWQEIGVLVRSEAQQAPWTPVERLDETRVRMYVFAPGQIEVSPREQEDQA